MQEKYEETMAAIAQMEKRAVMAETMLEATIQYQSNQVKAQELPSPRYHFAVIFFCLVVLVMFLIEARGMHYPFQLNV